MDPILSEYFEYLPSDWRELVTVLATPLDRRMASQLGTSAKLTKTESGLLWSPKSTRNDKVKFGHDAVVLAVYGRFSELGFLNKYFGSMLDALKPESSAETRRIYYSEWPFEGTHVFRNHRETIGDELAAITAAEFDLPLAGVLMNRHPILNGKRTDGEWTFSLEANCCEPRGEPSLGLIRLDLRALLIEIYGNSDAFYILGLNRSCDGENQTWDSSAGERGDSATVSQMESRLLQVIRAGYGKSSPISVKTSRTGKRLDSESTDAVITEIEVRLPGAAFGHPGALWDNPETAEVNARRGRDGKLVFDQVIRITPDE